MSKIRILPNGPYQVSEDIPMANAKMMPDAEGASDKWAFGKEYPQQQVPYHLCRCGHSSKKPYCDGTHKDVKFDGTETALHGRDEANTKIYRGETIDLMDERSLCAQMRFCDRKPSAWEAAIESGEPGYQDMAEHSCVCCASGRLTLVTKEGELIEPKLKKEISPVTDVYKGYRGPLWAKGGIEMEGADGEKYMLRNRMTLCRCGESQNKPFCDISHLGCEHMKGSDE